LPWITVIDAADHFKLRSVEEAAAADNSKLRSVEYMHNSKLRRELNGSEHMA